MEYMLMPFKPPMIQYSMEASSRSGSAVSLRAIRAVCARECTAMPASTMVPLRPLLSRLERARANTTASSAPAKADSVTAAAPDRNKIPAAAPALAPEDTPMISGEASGLWNTVW